MFSQQVTPAVYKKQKTNLLQNISSKILISTKINIQSETLDDIKHSDEFTVFGSHLLSILLTATISPSQKIGTKKGEMIGQAWILSGTNSVRHEFRAVSAETQRLHCPQSSALQGGRQLPPSILVLLAVLLWTQTGKPKHVYWITWATLRLHSYIIIRLGKDIFMHLQIWLAWRQRVVVGNGTVWQCS